MARTKGDGGAARSVGAKAPRKALGGGSSGAASRAIASAASPRGGGGSGGGGGGAGYNPMGQPVPGWQKPLTSFFKSDPNVPPPPKMKDEEVEVEGGEEDGEMESRGKSKKPR